MSGKRTGHKSARRKRKVTGCQKEYCALEGRRLLAVTASLSGSTLSIFGDASANRVIVSQSGSSLSLSGDFSQQYNFSNVSQIEFFGSAGNDFFENRTNIDTLAVGHEGNDTLITAGGTDRLFGNDGNDTLISTGGNDRLVGHDGNDTLSGGIGNDALFGLNGEDELNGEDGDDVLVAGTGDDEVFGGDGDDLAFGHFGNDRIFGGAGNDRLFGQNDNDWIEGGDGDDVVRGNAGIDTLLGNLGNDRILGDAGNDTINGGAGNETIYGGNGNDLIRGGEGKDLIFAGNGNDQVFGENGNDTIRGNGGNDTLSGGGNADRIAGDNGDDTIDGGAASDAVFGDAGADTITADSNDRATGGAGNDLLQLGAGSGGSANYSGNESNYVVTLSGDDLVVHDSTGADGQDIVAGADTLVFADGSRVAEAEVTQRVFVQPIVASDNNGSNTAVFFGDTEAEFEIMRVIDEIYLQAGIDVEWLDPNFTSDTFVNEGFGTGARSQGDLVAITNMGDFSGTGSRDPLVVDLYFVNRVPGFASQSANTANGLAFVGSSGVAMHVGDNLVDSTSGRRVVGRVAAHEIAHNLGLSHLNDSSNLMDDGEELNVSQINVVRDSLISQLI